MDGFVISPETGVITLTKVLDREQQGHYSVTGNLLTSLVLALRYPHLGIVVLDISYAYVS